MKFRKKPLEVEAHRVSGGRNNFVFLSNWCGGCIIKNGNKYVAIIISTLKGDMWARVGYWIVKDTKGEFYPVKDDIFRETYELIDEN